MKVIFFGTSEFAVKPLEAILNSSHEVLAVVTQPTRPRGRGLKVLPQAVQECAGRHNLKILKFDNVNSKEAIDSLKKEAADIFVVVAFGQILSKEVLGSPELYSVNIHASLLPKYRGAAPIQWAIINGEKKTGVSIIRMNESLDKGDIITQQGLDIDEDDDGLSLSEKLSNLGVELIIKTLGVIESDDAKFTSQDEARASYAPKLKKDDGLIDWKKQALSIKNLVRGCSPWPSAYTYLDGKLLKILKVSISTEREYHKPGRIIDADEAGISVACKGGIILIKRLQLEGKRPLDAAEFLRGRPFEKDSILGR